MKKLLIKWVVKILAFYYRIINYIKVTSGYILISPSDIIVDTSMLWKGEIAPKNKVFYITKYRMNGVFYSKNIEINRKDLPPIQEVMLKYRVQRIFANTITEMMNKKSTITII